jgi:exonuclease III
MGALRVATVHIWCRHGDWEARREVLREGFKTLQPDLVALQETVVTDESDQTRELFDDEYYVLHQGRRTPEGVGCSIVSRWPPVRVDEIDLCVTERVDPQDFPGRRPWPSSTHRSAQCCSSTTSRTGRSPTNANASSKP